MRTITFYSYKGGVGRSLALAQVATWLTRLGRRVVALDLDFEAAGLHYKFFEDPPEFARGALDLATDLAEGREPDVGSAAVEVVDNGRGWLKLIPAGALPSAAYWQKLLKTDWHSLFMGQTRLGIPIFLEIRERIREVLEPDFLLIDARTGITEVGGAAVSFLPTDLVAVAANNAENRAGMRMVLRSTRQAIHPPEFGTSPPRLHVVLSRLPEGLQPELEERVAQDFLTYLNESVGDAPGLGLSEVVVLHSHPELALRERALLEGSDERPPALFADYCRLLASLVRKEDVEGGVGPVAEDLMRGYFDDPKGVRAALEMLSLIYPLPESLKPLMKLYAGTGEHERRVDAAVRLWRAVGDAEDVALAEALVAGLDHDWPAEFGFAVWEDHPRLRHQIQAEVLIRLLNEGLEPDARRVLDSSEPTADTLRALNDAKRFEWVMDRMGDPSQVARPVPRDVGREWAKAALFVADLQALQTVAEVVEGLPDAVAKAIDQRLASATDSQFKGLILD